MNEREPVVGAELAQPGGKPDLAHGAQSGTSPAAGRASSAATGSPGYAPIRDAWLDGETDYGAASILIGELELTDEQRAEWAALGRMEQGLRQVGAAAELPWTRLRVETALAGRERARQWLAQHPRGLLGLSGLSLGPQDWRTALQALAALLGGALGWGGAALLTGGAHGALGASGVPVTLLAAGAGAVAALAVVRWPELRGYFTA
jgi:hypothetical protein